MNRLFYSSKQEKVAGTNLVLVDGEWKKYTEWCHKREESNWDDAVVVYEREEEPQIKVCKPTFDNYSMLDMFARCQNAIGKVEIKEDKHMKDFKVKCVKAYVNIVGTKVFTTDKIYEIKDGRLTDDKGHTYTYFFNSIEQINRDMESKFKLVEDEPSFKVRCVNLGVVSPKVFTVNKVYEIKNGILTSDRGLAVGDSKGFKNVDELNSSVSAKFELVEENEMKQFTKADLRTGMRVKTRDDVVYVVFKDIGKLSSGRWWLDFDQFSEDLTSESNDKKYDIITVYSCPTSPAELVNISYLEKPIWQRTEPKRYTISEAEAKLAEIDGQAVEIVKEG